VEAVFKICSPIFMDWFGFISIKFSAVLSKSLDSPFF